MAKNYFDVIYADELEEFCCCWEGKRSEKSDFIRVCEWFQIISEYINLIQKTSEYMSKYVKLICKNNIRIYFYIYMRKI